ncbi:PepSY domain-containing protein [Paracoccus sp. S1E-3]|uniref:PepSY domain-containing protein n=1 Tax=Paracoccus sp. S1E-3 TaxID=2756130 RepID=UPI0015EF7AEE|nr:PepSY domain-containing protein [Paracoccus sp. S1E-3]MBA4490427.1 PepSY domain-containing protein [Paracoccus sp. S1E-3]
MTKISRTTTFAAALALISMPALAQVTAEQVTQSLEGQGYTDIRVSPEVDGHIATTATDAEGVEVVIVHDASTGQVVSAAAADAQPAQGGATPAPAPGG